VLFGWFFIHFILKANLHGSMESCPLDLGEWEAMKRAPFTRYKETCYMIHTGYCDTDSRNRHITPSSPCMERRLRQGESEESTFQLARENHQYLNILGL
jgi:hypothetical protein